MIKEIKYLSYILIIFFFIFFTTRHYFSEKNILKHNRKMNSADNNLILIDENIPVLKNDTDSIIEYVNNDQNENKKKYKFWELLKTN